MFKRCRTVISALRGSDNGNDSGIHSALQTLVSSERALAFGSGTLPKSERIIPNAVLVYDFELE